MTKNLLLSLSLSLTLAHTQGVLDSFSPSGNVSGVKAGASFSWSNVTGTSPNRGLLVLVTGADLNTQSVSLGNTQLNVATQCNEPQYQRHSASAWTLAQPPSGTASITVTLGGATQFHNNARNVSAVAYNLSNVDPSLIDKITCHVSPIDSKLYVQSEVIQFTTSLPNELILFGLMNPNVNDAAKIFNWPGTEDQLTVASGGDVSIFSHLGDSGAAGLYNYHWDWQNFEPVVSVIAAIKTYPGSPPPPLTSNNVTWAEGNLSDRPIACAAAGLNIYLAADIHTLFWCIGPGGSWYPPAPVVPLPGGDDWPMAFHDAAHTGRSADIVTPPLRPIWQWKNNTPFDVTKSAGAFNLPVAAGDRLYFQGGLNANRLISLHQDRSFAFESDNSGYTESGWPFQFLNYPVLANGRVVFGSTDFTTTVDAANGSGFFNIYNTNGGWPSGGSTTLNGIVAQQFVETDSGLDDVVVYQSPTTLAKMCTWQAGAPRWDISFRVPAIDGKVIYANVNGSITALDATTCALLWSTATFPGVSPAVDAGVVYFHTGTTMVASKGGSTLWRLVVPRIFSPIVSNGVLYGGAVDGTFYALRVSDGLPLWTFKAQAAFTPAQIPALSGNLIYVPSADGQIYTLDTLTGRRVDKFTGVAAWGPVVISHGLLYAGDSRGTVWAFSPSSAR